MVDDDLHGIGEMARVSGLSVSALRYYDRTGVLVPALVDPVTGYRWYSGRQVAPARLVAGLRRVGMPLPEIATVVRTWADPPAVRHLVDRHLRRLEDGLADARREFTRIHALLSPEEPPMTTRLVLSRVDLAAAIDAVRFAVGTDPDLPVLASVLFDADAEGVRLFTTDRHRLAVAGVVGKVDGPAVQALAPVGFVDEVRALLDTGVGITPEAHVHLDQAGITVSVAGRPVSAEALPYDFPDYRRLLKRHLSEVPARRVPVDVPALRAALTSPDARTLTREYNGSPIEVSVLGVDRQNGLRLLDEAELAGDTPDVMRVGVNRGYLLEALDATGQGQLLLELDGPIAPLAVRLPDDSRTFSILMPVRL